MIQKTFVIEGQVVVQLPSTPNSGLFKFMSLDDGEIILLEKCEIPAPLLKQLKPLEQ